LGYIHTHTHTTHALKLKDIENKTLYLFNVKTISAWDTYIHLPYHSRFIPKEASQIFLQNTHVLSKWFSYEEYVELWLYMTKRAKCLYYSYQFKYLISSHEHLCILLWFVKNKQKINSRIYNHSKQILEKTNPKIKKVL
jgi:hypothetical protein